MEENGEKPNSSNWNFRQCLKWTCAVVIVHAIVTAFWYKKAPFLLFIFLFPIFWMFILVMDYLVVWLPPGTIEPWLLFRIFFALNEAFYFVFLFTLFWGLPRFWGWWSHRLFLLELNFPLLKKLSIPGRWACVLPLFRCSIVLFVWLLEYPHSKTSISLTFPARYIWDGLASFSHKNFGLLYQFQDIPESLRSVLLLPISLAVDIGMVYVLGVVVMKLVLRRRAIGGVEGLGVVRSSLNHELHEERQESHD